MTALPSEGCCQRPAAVCHEWMPVFWNPCEPPGWEWWSYGLHSLPHRDRPVELQVKQGNVAIFEPLCISCVGSQCWKARQPVPVIPPGHSQWSSDLSKRHPHLGTGCHLIPLTPQVHWGRCPEKHNSHQINQLASFNRIINDTADFKMNLKKSRLWPAD